MSIDKKDEQRPWKTPKSKVLAELGPYLHLGTQLTITVVLGVLAGWWLDGKFDTNPVFIITCSLLSVAVALYSFFKSIADAEKSKKKKQNNKQEK